jgi:hypothetical protein
MNPDSALLLSAADARRERQGCILLLQVPRNNADAGLWTIPIGPGKGVSLSFSAFVFMCLTIKAALRTVFL